MAYIGTIFSSEEYNKSKIRIDTEENYVKKNKYTLKKSKQWTFICDQGPHTVDGECKVIFKSFDNNKKTSFPYFGVKLSFVCLMIAYRKKLPKVTQR